MPLFKLSSEDRSAKVVVCARDLNSLKVNGSKKLKLTTDISSYQVYDDSDGTLIDDDECLTEMAEFASKGGAHLLVMLLPPLVKWTSPESVQQLAPTTPGTPTGTLSTSVSRSVSPVGDNQPLPAARTSDSETTVSVFPPVRQYVKDLRAAVKSPLHVRNKSVTKAKKSIIKSLCVKLKKATLLPGAMKKYCDKLHEACAEAFTVTIKSDDDARSTFKYFVHSLYNAVGYARAQDLITSGNAPPRRRGNSSRQEDQQDEPDEPDVVPFLCTDSNGCAEGMWEPPFEEEDVLAFEDKRMRLMQYHGMQSLDDANARAILVESYPYQRHMINRARTASQWREVFTKWPILLNKDFLLTHCNQLLGKDCYQVWSDELAGCPVAFAFMEDYCNNQNTTGRPKQMMEYIKSSKAAQESQDSRSPLTSSILPLLLGYFREGESEMFMVVEEMLSDDELLTKVNSASHCPILVVKGSSLFDADAQYLVIFRGEFKVKACNFMEGLLILMMCYYAFNTSYPKKAAATTEFIQRFFLRINPEIQCRIEGLKFKKSINPSVAKLAGALTDFEAARSRWSMEGVVANV